ncbi:MAG: GH3 auxin-responsive promoter family protein [Chlorobi bacterium]|nr:GH3 auxin-responsive promoter family protein [Chlorobiota bacterium]
MKTWKEIIARKWAALTDARYRRLAERAAEDQRKWMHRLVRTGRRTAYGRAHGFDRIRHYHDFRRLVPLREYEDIRPYIQKIIEGEKDVLWPGRPLYFAKTSGTTSGAKHIPISRQSMPYHVRAARDLLLLYVARSGNSAFLRGKMIFLQGSPRLRRAGDIPTGRLSGIAAHYVPAYLQRHRMPSPEVNMIEDWETKLDRITDETLNEPMTLISGIPSWVGQYFEKLVERTGKPVGDIFPEYSVLVHGGAAFGPYRERFRRLTGREPHMLETYPASEGFIAFRDDYRRDDMLLLTDHGIFYEFIPLDQFHAPDPPRLTLEEVEPGIDYAIVLTTNAGLWAYVLGDTVRFTSIHPYRLKVTGRVRHFLSAFGEHVIAAEVEEALRRAAEAQEAVVSEFTVAPRVDPPRGLPYHEWLVEFDRPPRDMGAFASRLDAELARRNIYYRDLIEGKVLRPAVVSVLKPGALRRYMAAMGKLGGQHKIPRLRNDREVADWLHRHGEVVRDTRENLQA